MPNNNLLKEPITDVGFIMKLLPHRAPMLMVDGLYYFSNDKTIATLTVLETNIFTEHNKLAESGLIEHMAQTAALMTGYKHTNKNLPVREGFIASIKNLKIEALPKINETISTEVKTTFEMTKMTNVALVSKQNGDVLATAEMTLVLKDDE